MSKAVLNSHIKNSQQRNIHTGKIVQMQTAALTNFATSYVSPEAFMPIILVITSMNIGQYLASFYFGNI